MPTLTLKNIPAPLHAKLKESAEKNGRSSSRLQRAVRAAGEGRQSG